MRVSQMAVKIHSQVYEQLRLNSFENSEPRGNAPQQFYPSAGMLFGIVFVVTAPELEDVVSMLMCPQPIQTGFRRLRFPWSSIVLSQRRRLVES